MSEETKDAMTPAQREAICKAWDILCEHFERVLLVVDFDVDEEGKQPTQGHEGFWHGGALSAVGMAEFAKDRIMKIGRRSNEPEEEN